MPCGVFFALWGLFTPDGGFLGAFFRGIFEKIPHEKVSAFNAFWDFWGEWGIIFISIYESNK